MWSENGEKFQLGYIIGYLDAVRLNGKVRITMKRADQPVSDRPDEAPAQLLRFFTVAKLQRALGEPGNEEALQAALNLNSDDVVRRALAGTLAVPETQIRRSRTALFIYLLKRHAQST
jgi:hypothetical protein